MRDRCKKRYHFSRIRCTHLPAEGELHVPRAVQAILPIVGTRANPGDFHDGFKDFWKVFYFLTGFLFLRGFYFLTGTGSRNVKFLGYFEVSH